MVGVGLDLLDYFFVKLMQVFSLMPMLEPPFSATRYTSFFVYARTSPRFCDLIFGCLMPVFVYCA